MLFLYIYNYFLNRFSKTLQENNLFSAAYINWTRKSTKLFESDWKRSKISFEQNKNFRRRAVNDYPFSELGSVDL